MNERSAAPIRRVAVALGGAALVGLVAWLGARQIGSQVWRAAWTLPLCLAIHAAQLLLSALAWRGLSGLAVPGRLGWWRIRWVREAVNSMLPTAQIGGTVVAIRLLAMAGVTQARATAATMLDLTIEAASQAAFTLAGVLALVCLAPDRRWLPWVAGGTAAICVTALILLAAQRFGLPHLLEAAAARLRRWLPKLDLSGLHAAFVERSRDRPAVARAFALQLAAWLAGTGEAWLVLAAMDVRAGAPEMLAIEALGMAARSAGFVVPGALGVQEAGFALVCGLFAIPADTAVALSMVKRAREWLVGVAGLLAWQGVAIFARGRVQPPGATPR